MTVEERLALLEQRLRRAEDELAIARLMASYGPLVDAGDADAVAGLWAEDGEYDVDGWRMRSRADVAGMVRSPAHQGLISRRRDIRQRELLQRKPDADDGGEPQHATDDRQAVEVLFDDRGPGEAGLHTTTEQASCAWPSTVTRQRGKP